MRLLHLRKFSDSKPSSAYRFAHEVSLHVPVTARAAEYWTDSSFSIELVKISNDRNVKISL